MIQQFEIIEASAGTGKTFSLSSKIIFLLATGVAPNKILALTFTKKATAEIWERICKRLANAASSDLLAEKLSNEIGITNKDTFFYEELLTKILAADKKIYISTIDGFFNKIAKLFSSELNLPHNWKIIEQSKHEILTTEAIVNAFSHSKEQQEQLLSLLQLLNRDEISRSIIRKIFLVTKDFIDSYHSSKGELLYFDVGENISDATIFEALDKLKNIDPPKTLKGQINKSWIKSLDSTQNYACNNNWHNFLDSGIAKVIINGGDTYYNIEISTQFREIFSTLINKAKYELLTKFRAKALSTNKLLELVRYYYLENKHQQSAVTFNDIQNALENINLDKELLYIRLDNKFDHILVDEFQDTSISQWKILEPIIDEVISANHKTCFVVGDKKQAIYGWRGGKSEIFDDFRYRYPQSNVKSLSLSYRSSKTIINNVNRLFGNIANNRSLEAYPEITNKWSKNYLEHSTTIESKGYVKYELLESDSNLNKLAEELKLLIDNKDFGDINSVGILVQRNEEVQEIINFLSVKGILASMEGGTSLANSSLAKALLASIQILENPLDTEKFFIICCSPLGKAQPNPTIENLNDYYQKSFIEFSNLGFSKYVSLLANRLLPYADHPERARLRKIVQIANVYEGDDYTEFCNIILQTKFSAPSEQGIRVMTIHQSKGLEFDAVFLPFLEKNIDRISDDIIYSENKSGEVKILPYPNKMIRNLSNEIRNCHTELLKSRIDGDLSVLYVALTRAKNYLSVYINKSNQLTLGKILQEEFFQDDKTIIEFSC